MKKIILSILCLNFLSTMGYAEPFIAMGYQYKSADYSIHPLIVTSDFQKKEISLSTIGALKSGSNLDETNIACNDDQCIATGYSEYREKGELIRDPFILQSRDQGKTWLPFYLDEHSDDFYYSHVGCTDKMCMAIKITRDDSHHDKLAIAVRNNQDSTWVYPESIERLFPYKNPKKITIFDVGCQGAVCHIAGNYHDSNDKIHPLLIHTSDHGVTWSYPTIGTHYKNPAGSLFTVSCQETNCLTSGRVRILNSGKSGVYDFPLLLTSADYGKTWKESDVPPIPPIKEDDKAVIYGHFIKNSQCSNSFCVAVGDYGFGALPPLVMVSHDKGVSWFYPQSIIDQFPSNFEYLRFFGLSLQGDIGLASGFYSLPGESKRHPLLARTVDAGRTWNYIFPNDYPQNAFLFFQLSSYKGHFFSVGDSNGQPTIVSSDDLGLTWSYIPLDLSGSLSSFINNKKCPSCYFERKKLSMR